MPSYAITEPHPTVRRNAYAHTGRGGAGNTFRASSTTPILSTTTTTTTGVTDTTPVSYTHLTLPTKA